MVKRMSVYVLLLLLLLTFFCVSTFAVETVDEVNWDDMMSKVADHRLSPTEGDRLFEFGDHTSEEREDNNSIDTARDYSDDIVVYGTLTWKDLDYYKIEVKQTSTIVFMTGADKYSLTFSLLDETGEVLLTPDYTDYDQIYLDGLGAILPVGTYYIVVKDPYAGNYYSGTYYTDVNYFFYYSTEEIHDRGYGQCGDDVYWFCSVDGVLEIFGSGDMYDFEYSQFPWAHASAYITKVTIEEGVTSIGSRAFFCRNLTEIVIPESVKLIGNYAFDSCDSLEEIIIPGDDAVISSHMFTYGNERLKLIIQGDNVHISQHAFFGSGNPKYLEITGENCVIDNSAFNGNDTIESLYISGSVQRIGQRAFAGAYGLKEVHIDSDVELIDNQAFGGVNALESMTITGSVNTIGEGAIYGELLESVHIGGAVGIIKSGAFSRNVSLTDVTIAGGVNYVGEKAFSGCTNLKKADFLETATYIGPEAFLACAALEEINLYKDLSAIDTSAFQNCLNLKRVYIGGKVDRIGVDAFAGCSQLGTVIFENDAPCFETDVFRGVTATVYYPANNSTWTEEIRQNYGGTITWIAHIHDDVVVTEPTCTELGYTSRSCSVCGIVNIGDYVDPLGHDFGEGEITTAPKAGTDGVRTFACGRCGEPKTEAILAYFTDIPSGSWFEDSVTWAYETGVTAGTGNRVFSPDKLCTRAQVITFLWRANGSPAPTILEVPFTDLVYDTWYTDAALWAYETGVTSGIGNNKFGPDEPMTRSQLVTLLWRLDGEEIMGDTTLSFTDVPEGEWYSEAVKWAVHYGITQGTGDNEFEPGTQCNRAVSVTFLNRYFSRIS